VTATAEATPQSATGPDDAAAGVGSAPTEPTRPVPAGLQQWRDPAPMVGWIMTAAVLAVAALTRLWALGWPRGKSFDEVYYATEAQEMLRYGYEDNRGYMFIVHPPLGKWLIAGTSWLGGRSHWLWHEPAIGWRMAPALAGIASVVILARTARRMFQSNLFGGIAGLLLALDGVSVVQSRVALLDIFLQLFILAGFAALVLDRDQMRGRLRRLLEAGVDLTYRVPTLGPRPWRLVAGVMFGLSLAVKWSALSFYLAFAVLSLVWDRGALKSAGVQRSWRMAARRSWIGAIGSLLVAPLAAYLMSYLGWFAGENSWGRHWADTHSASAHLNLPLGIRLPFSWAWVSAPIRSLGDYTLHAYRFHETLYSPHPYGSKPWSWLVLGRPVDYYYNGDSKACGSSSCAREILLIGTPLMWWAIIPALLWLAWHYVTTRDWRAAVVWVAFAAGWLVWFPDLKRTMFLFYMTPLMPFLVLGITLGLGTLLGPAVRQSSNVVAYLAAERRRAWGSLAVAGYLGLVVADFAWMWPLYTGGLLTYNQWHAHMWFPSWV
jgi:dolichyl-phosphate-mannose-protein mannosyltransferase